MLRAQIAFRRFVVQEDRARLQREMDKLNQTMETVQAQLRAEALGQKAPTPPSTLNAQRGSHTKAVKPTLDRLRHVVRAQLSTAMPGVSNTDPIVATPQSEGDPITSITLGGGHLKPPLSTGFINYVNNLR